MRQSSKSEGEFKDAFDYEEISKFVKDFMQLHKEELIKMTELAMSSLK
jgi:dihydroneopterin aldolase